VTPYDFLIVAALSFLSSPPLSVRIPTLPRTRRLVTRRIASPAHPALTLSHFLFLPERRIESLFLLNWLTAPSFPLVDHIPPPKRNISAFLGPGEVFLHRGSVCPLSREVVSFDVERDASFWHLAPPGKVKDVRLLLLCGAENSFLSSCFSPYKKPSFFFTGEPTTSSIVVRLVAEQILHNRIWLFLPFFLHCQCHSWMALAPDFQRKSGQLGFLSSDLNGHFAPSFLKKDCLLPFFSYPFKPQGV